MVKIPEQLSAQRFILLELSNDEKTQKKPLETGWTKDKNYSKSEIISKNVEKYGVVCGINNLIVVDCDSLEFQEAAMKHDIFKRTFTVKTAGKGLYHFYFFVDDVHPKGTRLDVFKPSGKVRVADIQGKGTQVLGPNSVLNNGKSYDIVNDVPISSVSYLDLLSICNGLIPNIQAAEDKSKKIRKSDRYSDDKELDPTLKYIKSKLTIKDLLEDWGINTRQGRNSECPFHSSESGQCFSYDLHQFHCFHCNRSGSMFDLAMEYYDKDFVATKNILAERVGVPEEVRKEAMSMAIRAKKAEMTEYLVDKFMKDNYIYTIRDSLKPEMWIFHNGIYIPEGETYISEFCRAALCEFYTSHSVNQVIAKIRADTYINEECFFNKNYEYEIPVKNGILNIITKKISNFNPEKIFFNKLPMFYDETQLECKKIKSFLESTFTDPQDVDVIQEMFGYTIWKSSRLKKAFMLLGSGDNGKSIVLELMDHFLGESNISNVSLHDIDNEKFSVSGLFGKMANINADIGKGTLEETQMFKKIVFGDTIDAQRKFLTPIKFKNYAKCIFALNKIPETEDKTDGFFTRWIIIEFPFTFKSEEEYNKLTETELATGIYKIADPFLIDKLTDESELSGFLNWVLDGFKKIYDKKTFSKNMIIQDIKDMWARKESSLNAFIEDHLVFTYDPDDYIKKSDLRFEYNKYCTTRKLVAVSTRKYNDILESKPIKSTRKKIHFGGGITETPHVWTGLVIK